MSAMQKEIKGYDAIRRHHATGATHVEYLRDQVVSDSVPDVSEFWTMIIERKWDTAR